MQSCPGMPPPSKGASWGRRR
ncbi:hypothetical protein E2320_006322, partial [Naja naja]